MKKVHSEGRFSRSEVIKCVDCGVDISEKHHSVRCESCAKKHDNYRHKINWKKRKYGIAFHDSIKNFFLLNDEKSVNIELKVLFEYVFNRDVYKICKNCGCLIFNAGKWKRKCNICLSFYGFSSREEYLEYNRKYNLKRLGSSNIGIHRNLDFKRESEIVRLEKNKILKYGNGSAPFIKNFWKDNKRDSFEKKILGTRSEFKI